MTPVEIIAIMRMIQASMSTIAEVVRIIQAQQDPQLDVDVRVEWEKMQERYAELKERLEGNG